MSRFPKFFFCVASGFPVGFGIVAFCTLALRQHTGFALIFRDAALGVSAERLLWWHFVDLLTLVAKVRHLPPWLYPNTFGDIAGGGL